MKKSLKITTGILCLAMLTACTNAGETTSSDAETKVQVTESESEKDLVFESEETTQETHNSNIDQQIDLIVNSYDQMCSGYPYFEDMSNLIFVAVTDLNRNGRLEVLFTSCQGSGAFSYTVVYEVSEDYTSMVKFDSNGENDESADFLASRKDENSTVVYDCYKKDGEYYYLLRDYASAGWSYKFLGFFAYSFSGRMNRETIGGISVSVEQADDKVVKTWLSDSNGELYPDGDAFEAYMNGYWSGYEQQKSCEVMWVYLEDAADFRTAVTDSWNMFNPESEKTSDISFSYMDNFGTFYGDGYEFAVQDSE